MNKFKEVCETSKTTSQYILKMALMIFEERYSKGEFDEFAHTLLSDGFVYDGKDYSTYFEEANEIYGKEIPSCSDFREALKEL